MPGLLSSAAERDDATDPRAPSHAVRFFQTDQYPADPIAEYLTRALHEGGAAIVIATSAHREAIARRLSAHGIDVEAAVGAERLVLADACAIAAALGSGELSQGFFDAHVGALVTSAVARHGGARAYGELVDVLAANDGDLHRAIALECAWNVLVDEARIDLLCGYSYDRFASPHAERDLAQVCGVHEHVDPGGMRDAPAGRLLAELEQTRAALETESSHRAKLESERAALLAEERRQRVRAEVASQHLARLQALTSALSSASSVEDVVRVVETELSRAVDTGRAALRLPSRDGARLAPIEGVGGEGFDRANAAFLEGQARWAEASEGVGATSALPVIANGQRIGVVQWTQTSRPLALEERALLEDCARQVALALDRALLYETARAERVRAEEASRAKDEFLAMLGHELRNPLSPMLTAVELMRLRGDGTLQREREVIERQVLHMVRLVDDLLDVSRVARGKVALDRAPVELASLVTDALEIASPALEARAQILQVEVARRGLRVSADRGRVVQVIVNLLTNASKFSPRGACVALEARRHDGRVALAVRDRGIGIDRELLPRVFDLFVQGTQMADRKNGGLGLGLAIARNLAELHGGSLTAHSDGPSRGSTFTLELPLIGGLEDEAPPRAREAPASSARRILVVDDNEDAAHLLRMILEAWGHEVHVAHDGPAALAIATRLPPEIALLDIGLPVMDGHELAERLAATLAVPPKLVAVTGYGQESDHARSRESGFCRHLVKPVAPDHLHQVLAELA